MEKLAKKITQADDKLTRTVSFQRGELLWYRTDVLYSEAIRSPDPPQIQCCNQHGNA